jgi:citrate lyase beta subunit
MRLSDCVLTHRFPRILFMMVPRGFQRNLQSVGQEVTRAKAVVEAYEEATKAGRGAIGKDGKMIDYANIRMAKALLRKFEVQSSK